ncbi:MAG: hypothetical protein PVH41_14445, partial [Anaerolineae bacterium]
RYLDDALCQVDGTYRRALATYSDALRQRNAALRHVRDSRGDPAQLHPFEEELARDGVLITLRRRALIDDLSERVKRTHRRLTGSAEWLRLDYQPNFGSGQAPQETLRDRKETQGPGRRTGQASPETDVHTLEGRYRQALAAHRQEEIMRGATVVGPHRDEMRFSAGSPTLGTHEVDLGTYGSRGQQRTAVLSLKIAELAWMLDETLESPVLLLDEVLAELDQRRRALLLEQVSSVEQAILTATDLDMFSSDFLGRAAVWEVSGGIVRSG